MALASTGSPGRIGDVHLDVITNIRDPQAYPRTTGTLETGEPVGLHRRRTARAIVVDIVISDAPPEATAFISGRWELGHARKTKERLEALAASGAEVEFYDGRELYRTPSGSRVWVIDAIDPQVVPDEQTLTIQTYRASITLGEVPRFSTDFTEGLDPNVSAELQDSADGVVDTGQQSTEEVPADVADGVVLQ